jgi:hypothetical protein
MTINDVRFLIEELQNSKIARLKDEVSSRQCLDGLVVNLKSKEIELNNERRDN